MGVIAGLFVAGRFGHGGQEQLQSLVEDLGECQRADC